MTRGERKSGGRWPGGLGIAALVLALSLPRPAHASDELPARNKALLLLRVLAYDQNLRARAGQVVTLLVVFNPGDGASKKAGDELVEALEQLAKSSVVLGLPIRVRSTAFQTAQELDASAKELRASAIVVCPGLEDAIDDISTVTRNRSILSVAASREAVEKRLSVAFTRRGPKAAIVINLAASRAEGVGFDSALLRLAEVLR